MSDLRYPIGRFELPNSVSIEDRARAIDSVAHAPSRMRDAVSELSNEQLDTPYRPGGWTVRQVVHHVPDSHMNGYIRFKLALTEDMPTIRPYQESLWAKLPDSTGSIDMSLDMLTSPHTRWVTLPNSITEEQWKRPFHHPEIGDLRIEQYLPAYAWHGEHHVAHITSLREREGW